MTVADQAHTVDDIFQFKGERRNRILYFKVTVIKYL